MNEKSQQSSAEAGQGPLGDICVLDIGHALAGPFAATLLADFGAEVIKVERLETGDAMRDIGPHGTNGPVMWKSLARGKQSLALDWTRDEGREILKQLVMKSDVLVESFRPGVLERNGVGPDTLHNWNPDLVILRVSGYGQTGPYSSRPGFGKAAEAMSGVLHMTGFADGPPVHPGFPMADMVTGVMGAYATMVALHARSRGMTRGQVIDLAIYEAAMRVLDYHIPVQTGTDLIPERNGNRQPLSFALSNVYQSKDSKWITFSAATFSVAKRVLRLVAGEEYANDSRFTSLLTLMKHEDEVQEKIGRWFADHDADDIIREFDQAQAVAALVYSTQDLLDDPHAAAREIVAKFKETEPEVVNVVPKLSQTPGKIRFLGPTHVGEHSTEILERFCSLNPGLIQDLAQRGIVGNDSK